MNCSSLNSCTCIIAYRLGTLDVQHVEPKDDWKLNPQDGVSGSILKIEGPTRATEDPAQDRA